MSNHQGIVSTTTSEDQNPNGDIENVIRDIHALSFAPSSSTPNPLSMATSDHGTTHDDYSNMSVTNSTLVIAGSATGSRRVFEEFEIDGTVHPSLLMSPGRDRIGREALVPVRSVKKEELESKITAWKNAKIAEITNRFKCEDAIIKGWESEQIQKATLKMKKVERKLEEKKARAMEKMENEIAKAHQKAEERRASAESKRGTKMARVVEVASLMKAVGRSPVKNFF